MPFWDPYTGFSNRRQTPKRNPGGIDTDKLTQWRVVSERPLPVSDSQTGGEIIFDLEPRSVCDVSEQKAQPSGEIRACIVDPVWKGWITLRSARGDSLCEPVEVDGTVPTIASSAASPPPPPPRTEQLTMAALEQLQFEYLADDVDIEPEMQLWTAEEARLCFETGGATRPPPPPPAPPEVEDEAPAAEEAASAGPVPMTDRQKQARDAGQWTKGMMVLLQGLSAEAELNGRSGVIAIWDAERARYDVRLANRVVRAKPAHLAIHPLQKQREANEQSRGDEVVFMTEDAKVARAGTYAVKLDPQFWYDQALERVFDSANEFEVLELPVEFTEDFTRIRKQYRKISLSVHPDKNKHPQADAAFRKVYGAFETLSDPASQRRLLFELGLNLATTEAEKRMYEKAGAEDDDDLTFQWWWEATVPDVEKAAEEAEGAEMDMYAASWVSDGLGDDVKDVRWIGIRKAFGLHGKGRAIFIDCREHADCTAGIIPGAWHVPMNAVMRYGISK